jgi:hypothetical protein
MKGTTSHFARSGRRCALILLPDARSNSSAGASLIPRTGFIGLLDVAILTAPYQRCKENRGRSGHPFRRRQSALGRFYAIDSHRRVRGLLSAQGAPVFRPRFDRGGLHSTPSCEMLHGSLALKRVLHCSCYAYRQQPVLSRSNNGISIFAFRRQDNECRPNPATVCAVADRGRGDWRSSAGD